MGLSLICYNIRLAQKLPVVAYSCDLGLRKRVYGQADEKY